MEGPNSLPANFTPWWPVVQRVGESPQVVMQVMCGRAIFRHRPPYEWVDRIYQPRLVIEVLVMPDHSVWPLK